MVCALRYGQSGFVHFLRKKIQGLFKDFPGPFLEISRTFFHEIYPNSRVVVLAEELKKSLILAVLASHYLKAFWRSITKSRTFKDRKPITRTFKALNFYFEIQGLSRTFQVRTNPVQLNLGNSNSEGKRKTGRVSGVLRVNRVKMTESGSKGNGS